MSGILHPSLSPLTATLILEHPEASVYELDRVRADGAELVLLALDLDGWFDYYMLEKRPGRGLHHVYLTPWARSWKLSMECEDPVNCSDVLSIRGDVKLHYLRRPLDPYVPGPERLWNMIREEAGLPPVAFPNSTTHILARTTLRANWTWKVTWHRGVRA